MGSSKTLCPTQTEQMHGFTLNWIVVPYFVALVQFLVWFVAISLWIYIYMYCNFYTYCKQAIVAVWACLTASNWLGWRKQNQGHILPCSYQNLPIFYSRHDDSCVVARVEKRLSVKYDQTPHPLSHYLIIIMSIFGVCHFLSFLASWH